MMSEASDRGPGAPGAQDPNEKSGWRLYAKATRKVGDGFVCGADRSPIYTVL